MDAVDDIKQRLAIEDVIGEYVELKRAGRNFRGLSPFGAEKTPSFMVSPEKQIWHDFSSGKGGNLFSFVMEMEGLDFKGALELLARKAGVDLAQYRGKNYEKNSKIKDRIYEILELSAKFYQLQLKNNKAVLEYVLKDRALTKETIVEFKVGYAPEGGQILSKFLLNKGFTGEEIKKAGLGNTFNGTLRDMFRGRMTIALMDGQGRVIGFTARIIKDDPKVPKYINTPATMLYDKSRHVFGLSQAKDSIRKADFAVVVEGNMDVIASHQAGVRNVVATAGTASTSQQLKEISKFSSDIRLCFDADNAGQNAIERTIILAMGMDIKLGVIAITNGKDPDELIKIDKVAWQKTILKVTYAIDWLIEFYAKNIDLNSGVNKKTYSKKILPVISRLTNSVEKEHYQIIVAEKLGVSKEAVLRQDNIVNKKVYKKPKTELRVSKMDADIAKVENQYLCLMLAQPSLRLYMNVAESKMFHNKDRKMMFDLLKKHSQEKPSEILEKIKDVQNLVDYGKVILLLYEELYANLEFIELQYEATRLQVRVIEYFVKEQKQLVIEQFQVDKNEAETTKLLQIVKELDQLLKISKETINGK